MTTSTDVLGSYLTDHLGGANAGVLLAQQLAERMAGSADGEVVDALRAEIEQDRAELEEMIARLGVGRHPVKEAAGRVAGTVHVGVTRVVTGEPGLGELLECESLAMGIDGKLALWNALLAVRSSYPVFDRADLARLAARARDQRERLEAVRCAAARRAFGVST